MDNNDLSDNRYYLSDHGEAAHFYDRMSGNPEEIAARMACTITHREPAGAIGMNENIYLRPVTLFPSTPRTGARILDASNLVLEMRVMQKWARPNRKRFIPTTGADGSREYIEAAIVISVKNPTLVPA